MLASRFKFLFERLDLISSTCDRRAGWMHLLQRSSTDSNIGSHSGGCFFSKNECRQNVARFRLYRLRLLQENMRFAAFFKLYKICIRLHRCNLKNFVKNRFEKNSKFREISAKAIANVAKFAIFCHI